MFRMGKSLIGGGGGDGGSGSGSGGSGGGFNPLAMFKQLDKNGDGKITEEDFVLVVRQVDLPFVLVLALRCNIQVIHLKNVPYSDGTRLDRRVGDKKGLPSDRHEPQRSTRDERGTARLGADQKANTTTIIYS